MSPAAFKSKYVTYEWAFALGIGIRFFLCSLRQQNYILGLPLYNIFRLLIAMAGMRLGRNLAIVSNKSKQITKLTSKQMLQGYLPKYRERLVY